ncbi:MAG TPA: nucleoside triphosphate pyrophosphatase [Myxococcota bacterium]
MSTPHPLVLASASPRRRDLLARAGVRFEVTPSNVPEHARPDETPAQLARRLASEKAGAVARRLGPSPARWVLGADTIVVIDGEVLGKPDDEGHALVLLRRLVGRRHQVVTGVALVASDTLEERHAVVESSVSMRAADERELRAYIATGESLDKAGAYAAQGGGRRLIEKIEGSETNVIGLPLEETLALLRAAGIGPGAP